MKAHSILLVVLLVVAGEGCNSMPQGGQNAPSKPKDIPTGIIIASPRPELSVPTSEIPIDPSLPIPAIPDMDTAIKKAKEDLAQRVSISPSQIGLIESKLVSWSDASLGCPQPGTAYATTAISGYLIRLEASGTQYEYHANLHNTVVYCENPAPPLLDSSTLTP